VFPLSAKTVSQHIENKDQEMMADVEVSQGWRIDRNSWSNSGSDGKPNIQSEISTKNIQIYQTRLATKFTLGDYFMRQQFGYGHIVNGTMQDSDYGRDNKDRESDRSTAKVKGGSLWDARLSFGKTIPLPYNCTISPLVGYFWQSEKISYYDAKHSKKFEFDNDSKRRHATYKSTWDAPFIGALGTVKLTDRIDLFAESDLLFAMRYTGSGQRVLDEAHFKHRTNRLKGFGHITSLGASYKLFENCSLKGEYQLSHLVGLGGKATEKGHSGHVPFHKATLSSHELRLTLDYAF
jgi:hypothetical protein